MKTICLPALVIFFTLVTCNILTAQITAGSVPAGMSVTNPNVNLSVIPCSAGDSADLDINCDKIPDMTIYLYKGRTYMDIPNSASLRILNDTFEICADNDGRPHYYNLGDILNCPSNAQWKKDPFYTFGDYGCMFCPGPSSKNNAYIAYRRAGQVGWIKVSFNLSDAGSCTAPITLSISSVLSPCVNNSVQQIFYESATYISPNPFSTQAVLWSDNLLKNATLTIDNCFGQQVKEIRNVSGQTITLLRDNLPNGLYFLRLIQDNKTFINKLVITDK